MGITKESPPALVLLSAYVISATFGVFSGYRGWTFFGRFLAGFSLYTFTEYFIHAFLFHIISIRLPWPDRLYYKVHIERFCLNNCD